MCLGEGYINCRPALEHLQNWHITRYIIRLTLVVWYTGKQLPALHLL